MALATPRKIIYKLLTFRHETFFGISKVSHASMFEVKCLTLFCRYKNTITDCKIMRGFYDDIG